MNQNVYSHELGVCT